MTDPRTHNVTIRMTQPAMQALLGDQPEIKAEITRQVASQFLERHLDRPMSQIPELSRLIAEYTVKLEQEFRDKTEKFIGKVNRDVYQRILSIDLHPDLKRKIDEAVLALVHKKIREIVDAAMLEKNLEARVQRTVDILVDEEIHRRVKAKMDDVLKGLK